MATFEPPDTGAPARRRIGTGMLIGIVVAAMFALLAGGVLIGSVLMPARSTRNWPGFALQASPSRPPSWKPSMPCLPGGKIRPSCGWPRLPRWTHPNTLAMRVRCLSWARGPKFRPWTSLGRNWARPTPFWPSTASRWTRCTRRLSEQARLSFRLSLPMASLYRWITCIT